PEAGQPTRYGSCMGSTACNVYRRGSALGYRCGDNRPRIWLCELAIAGRAPTGGDGTSGGSGGGDGGLGRVPAYLVDLGLVRLAIVGEAPNPRSVWCRRMEWCPALPHVGLSSQILEAGSD